MFYIFNCNFVIICICDYFVAITVVTAVIFAYFYMCNHILVLALL